MGRKKHDHDAKMVLLSQGAGLLVLLVFFLWVGGVQSALSALVGGLICFLPNLLLYRCVFKVQGACCARQIVKGLYWGEFGKLLFTVVLFGIVFQVSWFCPLEVLLGFCLLQMGFWVVPTFKWFKVRPACLALTR